MRITFIAPSNMSGGSKVVRIYARALTQLGHEVCIVSWSQRTRPLVEKATLWLKGSGWPDELSRKASNLSALGLDQRLLDRARPVTDADVPDADVVIATFWITAEWISNLSARKGTKVYFIQGYEIHDPLQKDRAHATYYMPFHKIVVAQWLKRLMVERYGDSSVDVVPNAIDRAQFFAPLRGKQPTPSVGFLYSHARVKGLDTTLCALELILRRFPDLRMMSFGSQHPIRRLSLPKNTQFFRLPPQSEIRKLYSRCDVWITASRSEGFNLTALEAMACRTPVVSTKTGWPAEALRSNWNGVLVEIDDGLALAKAVEWVLTRTDDEWRTLSSNAYATAMAVGSWQDRAKLFENALEHARLRAARGEI